MFRAKHLSCFPCMSSANWASSGLLGFFVNTSVSFMFRSQVYSSRLVLSHMAPSSLAAGLTGDKYSSMLVDEKLLKQLYQGSTQAVKQLLDDGALVDGSPELQYRPLTMAASFGRVEWVKLLVERGADLAISQPYAIAWEAIGNMMPGAGSRALHAAAFGGEVEATRALLELGANPDAVDDHGKTALMVASRYSRSKHRFAVVRELLAGGANATVASNAGALALHEAAGQGHTDVFALLLSAAPTTISVGNNGGFSALAYATLEGHEEAVSFLLSAGASDKAAWLETGWSPCSWRSKEGTRPSSRRFSTEDR